MSDPATIDLPKVSHGFDLTEDQRMIRDMVREFAQSEIAPIAAEIDENHALPRGDLAEAWWSWGCPGSASPRTWAARAATRSSYILAVEEVSRVCGSTGLTLAAHVSLGHLSDLRLGRRSPARRVRPAPDRAASTWAPTA